MSEGEISDFGSRISEEKNKSDPDSYRDERPTSEIQKNIPNQKINPNSKFPKGDICYRNPKSTPTPNVYHFYNDDALKTDC